jgi:putative glycosyltransferase (TIGR04372 family)
LNWPHLSHGLAYEWRRITRQGPTTLLPKIASRLLSVALWFLLLPVTLALHLAGYRRITVFADRIGHLAMEPDCLLKETALGLIPTRHWFMLAPPHRVANAHLLNYWKPFIRVWQHPAICFVLLSMSRWVLMRHDVSRYLLATKKAQSSYPIYAQWADRPPLLAPTAEDSVWFADARQALGLPKDAWYVCVHVREAGFSPIDEELQAHRNGSIEISVPAIEEITRRGGWVIRIGDASMRKLPPLLHVIDYAHHTMKSDRMDIMLCANARFILGNTSGIALVGTIFGVPCAIANAIPLSTLWFFKHDISIPKLLWSKRLDRHLRIDEIMSSPISNFRYAALYAESDIRVDENSAEDILDLATEMLDRLALRFTEQAGDQALADYFHSLFQEHHYSYGSCARVGARFLRTHIHLTAPRQEFIHAPTNTNQSNGIAGGNTAVAPVSGKRSASTDAMRGTSAK